jgi:hypothetical protein
VADRPGFDLGVLVGGVVAKDQVERPLARDVGVQMSKKAQELLVPMAGLHWEMTAPVRMLSAANRVTMPWRK